MNLSDKGLDLLTIREGKRNKAYKDVKGIWTIGVGHTGPEVVEGLVWDDATIKQVLKQDCSIAEKAIKTYVFTPLTQNQFDALVSFIFNVGVNAFRRSTLCAKLNMRDFVGAAEQFDRWHIPAAIIGRRDSEKAQFSS
ncbi:MAG: lysozyme [Candidatus Magasanikiibacteriota bacterium]